MTNYLHWRPKLHFSAPQGLINDPNGLIQIDGVYHVFFQWNPAGCSHQNKHWGLTTTRDWLSYTSPKIVLSPQEWFNANGCYSGSCLKTAERISCAYTGNVKTADQRQSYQVYAQFDPQTQEMSQQQVIINQPPAGYSQHFRDPKLFQFRAQNYLVIGAQTLAQHAACLVYHQTISQEWQLAQEIKLSGLPAAAYMFECPDVLMTSAQTGFLIGSPQGLPRGETCRQNRYHSGYLQLVGKLGADNQLTTHEFIEFDHGFEFYAPQSLRDESGRIILLAWLGIPDEEEQHPNAQAGWRYALSLPRLLSADGDKLCQALVPELEEAFHPQPLEFVAPSHTRLVNMLMAKTGAYYRLNLQFNFTATQQEFKFRFAINQDDYSEICLSATQISWQRSYAAAKALNGIRRAEYSEQRQINLEIIHDGSVVEIWLNAGLITLSGYVYPANDQLALSIPLAEFTSVKIDYAQIIHQE